MKSSKGRRFKRVPFNDEQRERYVRTCSRSRSPSPRSSRRYTPPTRSGSTIRVDYSGVRQNDDRMTDFYRDTDRDVIHDRSPVRTRSRGNDSVSRDCIQMSRPRSPVSRDGSPLRGIRSPSYDGFNLVSRRKHQSYESPELMYSDFDGRRYERPGNMRRGPQFKRINKNDRRLNGSHYMMTGKFSESYHWNGTQNEASQRSNIVHAGNAPLSPVICKFYNNEGSCVNGDSCKFLHLCKHFIQGSCRYGRVCKRSHDIFDKQPRSLLEKYGLLDVHAYKADPLTKRKIIQEVMDVLNKKKEQGDGHLTSLGRPKRKNSPYENISDGESSNSTCSGERKLDDRHLGISPEADLSDESQSFEEGKQIRSFDDFIPLEPNRKIPSKKTHKKKKMKVCNGETGVQVGGDDRLVPGLTSKQNTDDDDVLITFEGQGTDRRCQIRKIEDTWQISNESGEWGELDTTDSEEFSRMYYTCLEIRKRVHPSE